MCVRVCVCETCSQQHPNFPIKQSDLAPVHPGNCFCYYLITQWEELALSKLTKSYYDKFNTFTGYKQTFEGYTFSHQKVLLFWILHCWMMIVWFVIYLFKSDIMWFFSHAWHQFGGLLNVWFPKVLNLFVHDWICCEHTSGRWRWQIFSLRCTEKNNYLWQQTPLQTENRFTVANVRPLFCQTVAIFVSPSFTTRCLWLHSFSYLTMCLSILWDRHAACAINMNMRHTEKSQVYVWKETNVAFLGVQHLIWKRSSG